MNNGEYKGVISAITINPTGEKPVIFTRLTTGTETVTHAVRLHSLDSVRIGFDEYRQAFPKLLAHLDNEQLLMYMIEHTDSLINQPVAFAIEPQKRNGIVQKSAKGIAYFNVRLRSGVRNLDSASAAAIAKQVLQGLTSKKAVDDAFKDKAA